MFGCRVAPSLRAGALVLKFVVVYVYLMRARTQGGNGSATKHSHGVEVPSICSPVLSSKSPCKTAHGQSPMLEVSKRMYTGSAAELQG
jgi:hypothetical protein